MAVGTQPANSSRDEALRLIETYAGLRAANWTGGCRWCRSPWRDASYLLCRACNLVLRAAGYPLTSLEFATVASVSDPFHKRLANWKDRRCRRLSGLERRFQPEFGEPFAAVLSAYFEHHKVRLL